VLLHVAGGKGTLEVVAAGGRWVEVSVLTHHLAMIVHATIAKAATVK